MQRLSPKLLLVVALILSIGTAALIYSYVQTNTQPKITGEPVVVAVRDIPGRTAITADMVRVVKVPTEMTQPGTMRDAKQVVGVMTRVPISAGDQITERRLAADGKVPGFIGAIPRDKRAITVAVSDVTGVAGFVKAGDYVDVLITFDKSIIGQHMSNIMLQNALVLASNKNDNMESAKDKKEIEKMASVTLAVTPDEASKLALATEKGKIHLALRPFQPSVSIAATKTVTPDELVASSYIPAPLNAEPPAVYSPAPAPSAPAVEIIRGTKTTVATNY